LKQADPDPAIGPWVKARCTEVGQLASAQSRAVARQQQRKKKLLDFVASSGKLILKRHGA